MQEDTALVLGVIALFIFFGGEPDLMDGIISYLGHK
tara:strand:- start:1368 stop:1475 length:108 start_codon:yes stop_codon:yes gene_type:complete